MYGAVLKLNDKDDASVAQGYIVTVEQNRIRFASEERSPFRSASGRRRTSRLEQVEANRQLV